MLLPMPKYPAITLWLLIPSSSLVAGSAWLSSVMNVYVVADVVVAACAAAVGARPRAPAPPARVTARAAAERRIRWDGCFITFPLSSSDLMPRWCRVVGGTVNRDRLRSFLQPAAPMPPRHRW